jgi:hypothetical protein
MLMFNKDMSKKIHNLYITSTNKSGNDSNYNYNLYLSNYNIKIEPEEDAYININGFQSLNSFYNINDKSKNFTISVRTDQDMTFTYNMTLETGNYDIYEFQTMVNSLCSAYFTITYNKNKNKWNYVKEISLLNALVRIIPNTYNASYFGMTANIMTEINVITAYSNGIGTLSNIINMNNFSLIVIRILGLIEENKSIDNFNKSITKGDTCCIINRQDVAVGALINWTAINNSFLKKISNLEINQLTLQFYNEFNQLLTDIDDWVITLQLIIEKKQYQHLID